jgi:hypothetical protein
MNIMRFITKNSSLSTLHIAYKEKYIEEKLSTKFLGLQTDNHLNWKNHIEEMISKLSGACYASGKWSISVILTFSNQFTMHTSIVL